MSGEELDRIANSTIPHDLGVLWAHGAAVSEETLLQMDLKNYQKTIESFNSTIESMNKPSKG